jgi:hypothetical protein
MLFNIKLSMTHKGDEANYESHVVSEVAKSLEDEKIITASKREVAQKGAPEAYRALERAYIRNERIKSSFYNFMTSIFNVSKDDDKQLLRDAYKQSMNKTR